MPSKGPTLSDPEICVRVLTNCRMARHRSALFDHIACSLEDVHAFTSVFRRPTVRQKDKIVTKFNTPKLTTMLSAAPASPHQRVNRIIDTIATGAAKTLDRRSKCGC